MSKARTNTEKPRNIGTSQKSLSLGFAPKRFTIKLSIAIFLAALIPSAIIGIISIQSALESQRLTAREYYFSGAERVQERLMQRLEAASTLVLNVSSLLADANIPEEIAVQTSRTLMQHSEEVDAVGIYDIQGNAVEIFAGKTKHSLPQKLTRGFLTRLQARSQKENLLIFAPESLTPSDKPSLALCAVWRAKSQSQFTQGITSTTASTIIGFVLITLSNEYLCSVAAECSSRLFQGTSGRIFLADTAGRIIAHSNRGLVDKSLKQHGLFSQSTKANYRQYVGSVHEYTSFDVGQIKPVPMLGVALFVPLLQTIIVVEEPQSSTYSSLEKLKKSVFIWAGISLGLSVVLAIFLARQFSEPIQKLQQGASHLAKRDFSYRFNSDSNDEFGLLFQTFDTVTNELDKYDKLNLEEIIRERNKLQTVVRQAGDGILLLDVERKITLANVVFKQWFSPVEFPSGSSLFEISQSIKALEEVENKLAELNETQDLIRPCEISYTPENEVRQRTLRGALVRVVDDDFSSFSEESEASTLAYILLLRDVSREVETDKLKTELVAVVAHELRSPLNSIFGLAELIAEGILDEKDTVEYGKTIAAQSRKLADIINKFLDLSRLESGKTDIRSIPVKLDTVLRAAVSTNALLAAKKSIEITIETTNPELIVHADPDLLGQVMMNLLSNAIKYSLPKKKIVIEIRNESASILVSVKDEGYGISESSQQKLFSKFFRASDDQRVKNESGTGLGLAFVKQIIEQHGGEVGVESRLGEGSTFWFRLPN